MMKTKHNAAVLRAAYFLEAFAIEFKRSNTLLLNGIDEWDSPEGAMHYRDLMRTAHQLRALTVMQQSDL